MRETERNRALIASASLLVAGACLLAVPAIAAEPGYQPPRAEDQPLSAPEEPPGAMGPSVEQPEVETTTTKAQPGGVSLRIRKKPLVTYGDAVSLAGRLESRKKGKKVKVTYSEAGKHADDVVEKVKTGKQGKFRVKDTPKFTGKYRAEEKNGRSGPVDIEVKPRIDLDVERASLRGEKIAIDGTLTPAVDKRTIVIEQSDKKGWSKVDKAKVGKSGFDTHWGAKKPGEYRLRARFAGDDLNRGARQKDKANVYRETVASHYGSGFYGSKTACGQTLGKKMLGVANKTIPCGTKVTFYRKGREIKVPVIDRGPFVHGRDWDLTNAAAKKLKVNGVQKVWSTK
jgi:rare lipoprotein A